MSIAGVTKNTSYDVVLPQALAQESLHAAMKGGKFDPDFLVETDNGAPPTNVPDPTNTTTRDQRLDFIKKFGSVEAQKALKAILDSGLPEKQKNYAIRALVNDIRAGIALLKADLKQPLTDVDKNAYTSAVLTRIPVDPESMKKALHDHPEGGKAALTAYIDNLEKNGFISRDEKSELLRMVDTAVDLNGGPDAEAGVINKLLGSLKWATVPKDEQSAKPSINGKTAVSEFGDYTITLTTDEKTGKKQATIKNIRTGEETVVDPLALKNGTFDLEDPAGSITFALQGNGKTVAVTIKPTSDTPDSEAEVLRWGPDGAFEEVTSKELRQNLVDNLPPNAAMLYEISGKQGNGDHFTTSKPKWAPA